MTSPPIHGWEQTGLALVRGAVEAMTFSDEVRGQIEALLDEQAVEISKHAGHVLRARAQAHRPPRDEAVSRVAGDGWSLLPHAAQVELASLVELGTVEQAAERRRDSASHLGERLTATLIQAEPVRALFAGKRRLPGWATWLALILALLALRAYVVAGVGVSGGGMAPGLLGDHLEVPCETCGFTFAVGFQEEQFATSDAAEVEVRCPLCRTRDVVTTAADDLRDGSTMLVNRLAGLAPTPQRWEVWEYARGRTAFVKRVVGLPSETLEVHNGDLFVDGEIARKPAALQDALWQPVYRAAHPGADTAWVVSAGDPSGWRLDDPAQPVSTDGSAWLTFARPLNDDYAYNRVDPGRTARATADLRVRVRLTAAAAGAVELAIVEDGRVILGRFGVGPDGPAPAIVIDGDEAAQAKDGPRLRPGQAHALSLSSVDDRVVLELDGTVLLSWNDAHAPRAWCRRAEVRLRSTAGETAWAALALDRDILYLPLADASAHDPAQGPVTLGPDEVFLLGDNAATSSDSRRRGPLPLADLAGRVEGTF